MIWRGLLVAFVATVASAAPAFAGPVFVALLSAGASIGSAFAATAVGTFLATTVGRLLTTVALTALQSALTPKVKPPGIVTEDTQSGGTNPLSFVLGRYATAGYAVCPAMSHGDTRGRLTYVIDQGDIPITELERLIINDEYVTVDWTGTPHPEGYGAPVGGRYQDWAWIKLRTGLETTADTYLRAKYGSAAERPWLADMIGRGVPHAILTFRYKEDVYQGLPSVRFQVKGIKLYDPRKDATVGGSGAHRWATPSTWEWTDNPVVMIYNILRGIPFADGSYWGKGWDASDLPLDNWFAGMNACDEAVALDAGGTEPRYRAGYEVRVDEEPFDVIEELLKGCAGRIAFTGGQAKVRIGGPGLPVYFLTDDDVVRSRPEELDPFPGLAETYNAIHASYPEPESLWEAKDAPPRYNAGWEADDNDRRLVAQLNLPAVPYGTQVQRVMKAYIEEERRFRRHSINLPPEAVILEPLDTLSWTSARNGYSAKLFEIAQKTDDPMTMIQGVTLREVDPSDYDWTAADELPSTIVTPAPEEPAPFEVVDFAVTGETITDGTAARYPAIALTWTGDSLEGATGLLWETQRLGDSIVQSGSTQDVESGRLVLSEGILPMQDYLVRARLVAGALTVWTDWLAVTTPEVEFLVGQNSGTSVAYISQAETEGLQIVNASFSLDAAVSTETTVTASQTLSLTAGTKTLSLLLLGGGSAPSHNVQSPTNTVVALYNAGSPTGISWTSTPGSGGAGSAASGTIGGAGRSTILGLGGKAPGNSSVDATGYGAGAQGYDRIQTGGGGGEPPIFDPATAGGAAAGLVTVTDFDLSPYASPSLVITIGQRGRGTRNSVSRNGSQGVVVVTQKSASKVPAGVVPFAPTAVGTFSKAANATGGAVFPDLGTGLWVLTTSDQTALCLNAIDIDTAGTQLFLANALSATFMANKRPVIITGNATARTIRYAFHRMKL